MYRTIVARLPDYALQRRAMPHIGTSMAAPLEIDSRRGNRPQHSDPHRHTGAGPPHRTTAGPPRTPHRAYLAYGTALKLPLGPRNKKSAQTATFLRLAICSKLPNRESRHKNAGNWPCCGLLPPSGDEKRAPNRKNAEIFVFATGKAAVTG